MVGVASANIFNTKVIDYDSEDNWAPFVAPESWSCGLLILFIFVKADEEKIIC